MNRTFTLLILSPPGLAKVSLQDHRAHWTDDVESLSSHIDKGVSDKSDMVTSTYNVVNNYDKDGAFGVVCMI